MERNRRRLGNHGSRVLNQIRNTKHQVRFVLRTSNLRPPNKTRTSEMFTLPPDLPGLFRSPIPVEFLLGGVGFFVPGCFCCGGGGGDGCSKAYAWGGLDRGAGIPQLQDNDEYNPDTWTNKTDVPTPKRYLGYGAHISGRGYSCFGFSLTSEVQDTDEFDAGNDTWAAMTDGLNPARSGGGCASHDNALYCFYGSDASASSYLRDTDQYRPDVWTNRTDGVTPSRTHNAGTATIDAVYSTGGNSLGTDLADHEQYSPGIDSWASMTNLPNPARTFPSAAAIEMDVCLFGGESYALGTFRRDTDSYNASSGSWTSRTDLPTPARARMAAQSLIAAAYVYCGLTSGSTALQDNDEFIIDLWTTKTDSPTPARDEHYGTCL
jgi:hypothetical protein